MYMYEERKTTQKKTRTTNSLRENEKGTIQRMSKVKTRGGGGGGGGGKKPPLPKASIMMPKKTEAKLRALIMFYNSLNGRGAGSRLSAQEVRMHDALMESGQHHEARVITVAQARGDIIGRIVGLLGFAKGRGEEIPKDISGWEKKHQ